MFSITAIRTIIRLPEALSFIVAVVYFEYIVIAHACDVTHHLYYVATNCHFLCLSLCRARKRDYILQQRTDRRQGTTIGDENDPTDR